MMELARPWFLALWPVLLLLLWLGSRRSLAGHSRNKQWLCFGLRCLILTLLVLALAGVRALIPSKDVSVLFVVDDSASISPPAQKQAHDFVSSAMETQAHQDTAGIVSFAERAEIRMPPGPPAAILAWTPDAQHNATDIGRALEFSSAILPAQGTRRIVLLTDGNDTEGHAAEAGRRLADAGVELWTVPLHNEAAPEVLVEKVEIPRRLKLGEPFDLVANIHANIATHTKVKVYQNQFLIEQKDLDLKPGANAFRAQNLRPEGSFISYEVEVVPDRDTVLENNRATATASLRGEPKILVVDADEHQMQPLAEALRSQKIQVELRGPAGLPRSLEDLQQFDLFILSDISALRIAREQMELYRRWIEDYGGGFLMLGGESSYGVGGFYRTPIEQMLPVRMEHEDRQDTPSVALLVVLDRSGSMTAEFQGQTKISLADQGTVYALNALQPRDWFGELAVDTRSHTIVPLAPVSTIKGSAEPKIMSVNAGGGGIYIYTSLAEAFQVLRDVQARIKHVILFSDAADAEEKAAGEMADGAHAGGSALDLASAMLSAKITTSVVGLGTEQDKDTQFLRQLAERGNGRFYLTSDATSLPQIFSTETMKVAQSSLVEEPFLAVQTAQNPMIAGLDWKQSPLLLGYNTTKPKPTADVLLATERGEPLFAVWRYGLGQAAAFTSDAKSRWAAEWLQWPGYGKFWAQTVRGLMRKSDQSTFQVTTRETGDKLDLEIDAATPEGMFRDRVPIRVNALSPDGQSHTFDAAQDAPGSYHAQYELPKEGTTVFSIFSPDLPDAGYVFGHTRSYPREFLTTETNNPLLRSLAESTHGKYAPSPAEVFSPPANPARTPHDLTDRLLMACLILFPIDIWLRRRNSFG